MDLKKYTKFILKLINDMALALIPLIIYILTDWFTIPICFVYIVFVCGFNDDIFNYITKNKYNKKECK